MNNNKQKNVNILIDQNEKKSIVQLVPNDKNLNLTFLLVEKKHPVRLKRDSVIYPFLVADNTGSIVCNFFDEIGEQLKESDIINVQNAYASLYKNQMSLYPAKASVGKTMKVGEFFMLFNTEPNMSSFVWKVEKDEKTGLDVFIKEK